MALDSTSLRMGQCTLNRLPNVCVEVGVGVNLSF